eukprot:2343329-Pleurochrysis_carterae.AAC.1
MSCRIGGASSAPSPTRPPARGPMHLAGVAGCVVACLSRASASASALLSAGGYAAAAVALALPSVPRPCATS